MRFFELCSVLHSRAMNLSGVQEARIYLGLGAEFDLGKAGRLVRSM
jgi:hypothetical protein